MTQFRGLGSRQWHYTTASQTTDGLYPTLCGEWIQPAASWCRPMGRQPEPCPVCSARHQGPMRGQEVRR